MSLDELRQMLSAAESVCDVLDPLDADQRKRVLNLVLAELGAPVAELVPIVEPDEDEDRRSLPAPRDVADEVATKLVVKGWGYDVAHDAATAAIRELGKSAGVERLVKKAEKIGPKKKRGPKRDDKGRPLGIHARGDGTGGAFGPGVQDAIEYVLDHGEVATRDYAASRGLTMSGAHLRLKKAREAGAIKGKGKPKSHDFRWVPA